jgi:hypothetical protein
MLVCVSVPAAFDTDRSCMPSGAGVIDYREGNMVATSTSGGNSVVLVDKCFTTGKAAWEIKLEEDTNSQCTCFGAAIKPIRDCNYEKSRELWMYRAYNGCVVVVHGCGGGGCTVFSMSLLVVSPAIDTPVVKQTPRNPQK